jgi:transglutaminase-like putative cysteine protease
VTHLTRLNVLTFATFAIGFLAHAIAAERPESDALAMMAFVLLGASSVALRGRITLGVPRWIFNVLLLAATLNLLREGAVIVRTNQPEQAVATLANYLLALQLIKLFEGRRPRDLAQTIALNAMLVVAAVLESVTFSLALALVLYIPFVLVTVYAYHLYAGQFAAAAVSLGREPGFEELAPREPHARALHRDLAALAAVSISGAAVVATVVFFIMPRGVGEDSIGRLPQPGAGATTDFSDQVQLGGESIVSESRDIVLSMQRRHQGRAVNVPVTQYLRGVTLDVYDRDSFSWKRGPDDQDATRLYHRRRPRELSSFDLDKPGNVEQRFNLRSKSSNFLFALYYPIDAVVDKRVAIDRYARDGSLLMISHHSFLRYDLISDLDRGFGVERETEAIRGRRESPAGAATYGYFASGPIADEARRIIADAGLERERDAVLTDADHAILQRLEDHFRDRFVYTLDAIPPPGRDPIEWFLTEGREGHCEYFASAMVAMCRALGIHARVVTGFATSEFDEARGEYLARRNHAHAWVEAPVLVVRPPGPDDRPGSTEADRTRVVWRTYDPTPPSDRAAFTAQPSGIVAWARRLYEDAEAAWITGVMAFDSRKQIEFFKTSATSLGVNRAFDSMARRPSRLVARLLTGATIFVATFALVASLLFAARAAWRALAARFPSLSGLRLRGRDRSEAPAFFTRADRVLRRAGHARPFHRPPLEHARALERVDPELAEAAARIAHLHYRARYRAEPLDDHARRAGAEALRAMVAATRRLRRDGA